MTARIFSQTELDRIAADLLPDSVRDDRMMRSVTLVQLRPLMRTAEGRAELADRLAAAGATQGVS